MDMTKALAALRDFYEQVPGFETANYSTYSDYRKDYRQALKDLHECRTLYRLITDTPSGAFNLLTFDDLTEACRAFSGRLQFNDEHSTGVKRWNYTPGQYWPTEYRAAAVAVLKALLKIEGNKFNAQILPGLLKAKA